MSFIKKNILIICFTDTMYDARVARQIEFLKDEFQVTFAGFKMAPQAGVDFIPLPEAKLNLKIKAQLATLLLARQYEAAYWKQHPYKFLKQQLKGKDFDLILANDIESLPLSFYLNEGKKAKILFDAHEYAPRHFEDRLYWRVFFKSYIVHWCGKLIPKTDGMLTVCDGLAQEYFKEFNVMPQILVNSPFYQPLEPTPVDPNHIKLIHHGIVNRSRKIENMFTMMDYLDARFSLDIMLKPAGASSGKTLNYFEGLKKEASESSKPIKFIPSVSSKEVVPFINKYDIGIFLLEPINFNYTHALPNKLFDFVQARLGIGIGPSIEMKKIVEKHQLGVVSNTFSPKELSEKLNALSHHDIVRLKENSNQAARILSAEENKKMLIGLVRQLTQ